MAEVLHKLGDPGNPLLSEFVIGDAQPAEEEHQIFSSVL